MQYAIRKSRLSNMHYPLTNIQTEYEINRPIRYQITAKRNYFHRRQTDGETLRTTIGSFFRKKKKILKTEEISFAMTKDVSAGVYLWRNVRISRN